MLMFCEPSNEAEPERSPPRLIDLAVCNAEAVEAFPVSDEVTLANVTDELVPTA